MRFYWTKIICFDIPLKQKKKKMKFKTKTIVCFNFLELSPDAVLPIISIPIPTVLPTVLYMEMNKMVLVMVLDTLINNCKGLCRLNTVLLLWIIHPDPFLKSFFLIVLFRIFNRSIFLWSLCVLYDRANFLNIFMRHVNYII